MKSDSLKLKLLPMKKLFLKQRHQSFPQLLTDTILVPISGHTSQDRLNIIRTRVLDYVGDHRATVCAVFDFYRRRSK